MPATSRRVPALLGGVAVAVLLADVVAATVVGGPSGPRVPTYPSGPGVAVTYTAGGFSARFPHRPTLREIPVPTDGVDLTLYAAVDETDEVAAEVLVTPTPLDDADGQQAIQAAIQGAGQGSGLTLRGSATGRFRGDPAVVGTYDSARGELRAVAFLARGEVCLLVAPPADFGALAASFQLVGGGPGSTDA